MSSFAITRVGYTVDRLGEGLLWDDRKNLLYWADAMAGILHRLDPATGERRDFQLPGAIGSLAFRRSSGAVVALADGFYFLEFDTGATTPITLFDHSRDDIRFNDGAVDRQGRFVAGTMHIRPPGDGINIGTLHRLDPDGSVELLESGIGNTNGTCFSPDGRTFYFTDSPRREIYAYRYDPKTGRPEDRRIFATTAAFDSPADGQTVDADGFLWSAMVTGGKVVRFAPDGSVDRTIDMPVKHPTNVAFGGSDLRTLYVTSISKSPNITATESGAGGLFAITGLGVTGLPEPRFAG